VSNDNLYSVSLFRTVKYCPAWPTKGLASLSAVREWMLAFERAYDEQHLHSGIQYVTPADRHRDVDQNADVTPSSVAPGFRVRSNFIVFYHQLLGIGGRR